MSSPSNPRKRPAPGSVPMPQPMQQATFTNADQFMRWNGNNAGNFVDNGANNMNPYLMAQQSQQQQYPHGVASPSTALARRGMANALVPTNRAFSPSRTDAWPDFGDASLLPNAPGTEGADEHDNIEVLEEKAQRAKRDAQAKRKQIPPFVQKLNSFLEESKNTDLIRWSEKGDSFIVLDEDEFAKTLIPELFKHNNYASFVRQLNMYGFHKKVGLSDNSMKASERKNKSPSEYYNPYFRRGHPNLLWLINKPKSGGKTKAKKPAEEGEGESDEEVGPGADDGLGQAFNQASAPNRALPAPESGPLQRKDLAVVREQMNQLQQSQKTISAAINRLRSEHNQLYQQALAFQSMHDRHENSINAILNFLANVFRKSLEEQGGVQNLNDLLASIIPNVQMPQGQQGSVVDLGDWTQQQGGGNMGAQMGTPKRAQRLLPPIPNQGASKSPSPGNTSANGTSPYPGNNQSPQAGSVTELFDTPPDSSTPPSYYKQELESKPQQSMMQIIQDANASNANNNPPLDIPDVVAQAAQSMGNMTNDQRNRMLSILSGKGIGQHSPSPAQPQAAFASGTTPTPAPPDTSHTTTGAPNVPNANNASSSLSPRLPNNAPMPPSIQRMSQTEEELGALQRLQDEQAQKLDNLNSLLGPLSPSGRIPGIDDSNGSSYFNDDIDINQYLDSSAFTADGAGGDFNFDASTGFDTNYDWNAGAGTNIDFGVPGADGADGGTGIGGGVSSGGLDPNMNTNRVVETNTPSHKSPSPSGTEEIPREEFEASPGRSAKRQRQA